MWDNLTMAKRDLGVSGDYVDRAFKGDGNAWEERLRWAKRPTKKRQEQLAAARKAGWESLKKQKENK